MFLHIWMSLHKILTGQTKDSPSSRVIPKKLFSVILKNAKIHIYIFEASVGPPCVFIHTYFEKMRNFVLSFLMVFETFKHHNTLNFKHKSAQV